MPNRQERRAATSGAAKKKLNGAAAPAEEVSQVDAIVAVNQRNYLMQAIERLINRLAGEKMAAGQLDPQGVAVFAGKEAQEINMHLGAIYAEHHPEAAKTPTADKQADLDSGC